MLAATTFLLLVLTFFALASASPTTKRGACDISKAKINLPANQTALPQPGETPSFIALAFGTQNYTCSSSGTYTAIGAVAELFDISCLYKTATFATIQDTAYCIWSIAPPSVTPQTLISILDSIRSPTILGEHYFIPNPVTGQGISPKWDFTSHAYAGNPNAFVVAAKAGETPAPTGAQDISWVHLNAIQGSLAQEVYRVDTRGGPPPSSCTPGSPPITVKYTSKYWLYGGSVKK